MPGQGDGGRFTSKSLAVISFGVRPSCNISVMLLQAMMLRSSVSNVSSEAKGRICRQSRLHCKKHALLANFNQGRLRAPGYRKHAVEASCQIKRTPHFCQPHSTCHRPDLHQMQDTRCTEIKDQLVKQCFCHNRLSKNPNYSFYEKGGWGGHVQLRRT